MDSGRRMPKELQVRLIQDELRRLGIAPDIVDVEALIDLSLTYPENRANIMQRLRGIIPESQWMEITARSPTEAKRFERETRAEEEQFKEAYREVRDVNTARDILRRVYEEGEDEELKEQLFSHPEYLAQIIQENGERDLAERALNELADEWENLDIQTNRQQREIERLQRELEEAARAAGTEDYESLRRRYEDLQRQYSDLRRRIEQEKPSPFTQPSDYGRIAEDIFEMRLEIEDIRRELGNLGIAMRQREFEAKKQARAAVPPPEEQYPEISPEKFNPPPGTIILREEIYNIDVPGGWIATRCPFCGMLWYYPSDLVYRLKQCLQGRTAEGLNIDSIIALCPNCREMISTVYNLFAFAVDMGCVTENELVVYFNIDKNRLRAVRRRR